MALPLFGGAIYCYPLLESAVKISLRDVRPSDMDFLMWLRDITMSEHITNVGLEVSPDLNRERILVHFDDGKIIQINGEDAGLFKVHKGESHWDLVQIQVSPHFQGQGIGRYLIENLLIDAAHAGKSVLLNVFKKNPAFRLYDSLGFKTYEVTETTFEMKWVPV